MARFMHAHGVDCGIEGCADGRETLGYFSGDGRRRTAAGHGPALPNPEGGDTWYHGARFSMHGEGDHNTEGYEAFDDFDDEEPSPEEKHEWGGGKVTGPDRTSYEPGEHADKHWNTDLGAHFTSLKAVARGFAGGGGVRGMTAKPSMGRVLHAGLHMSNPAVFADEREMGAHAARWAHKEGYRFHSPFGDAKEPVNEDHYDELRHGNYWHEDEDGETPYEHLGNYSGAHPEHMVDIDKHGVQPRHTQEHLDQYLANHPNREEITTGWKNHLKSQGHDGILYGNTLEGPHGHACAITLDDTTIHHRKWEWLNEHDRDEYDPHGETYKPSTSGAGQWNQDWHSRDGRKPYTGTKRAIHEHVIDPFEPTERLFAPTKEHLDETLFDEQERMRPEVRKEILRVTDHFFDTHGYTGHERWARVFLAGSQASYWGGNHDFDLLIGINYPIFRQAHPELDHLSDVEVDRRFNEQLRDDFNMDGWRPSFDPHGEPWDRTGYVFNAHQYLAGGSNGRLGKWHPSSSSPLTNSSDSSISMEEGGLPDNWHLSSASTPTPLCGTSTERGRSAAATGAAPTSSSRSGSSTSFASTERDGLQPTSRRSTDATPRLSPITSALREFQSTHPAGAVLRRSEGSRSPFEGAATAGRARPSSTDGALSAPESTTVSTTSPETWGSRLSDTRNVSTSRVELAPSAAFQARDSRWTTTTPAARGEGPAAIAFEDFFARDVIEHSGSLATETSSEHSSICDGRSWDISLIKPYAAYSVTDDVWAVRPIKEPEGHEFVTTEWYYFEGVASQILAAMKLQEPARTQTLRHIWDWVHGDRSRAFGPNGTGAFDRSNALEKYLSQYPAPGGAVGYHLMDVLREAKYGKPTQHQKTASSGLSLTPTGNDFNKHITEHQVDGHGFSVPEEEGWTTKVRFQQSDHPDLNHRIWVYQEHPPVIKGFDPFRKDVGWMSYHPDTGRVEGIQTHENFARRGVATGMWNLAKQLHEQIGTVQPAHSETQTSDGEAWAEKTAVLGYGEFSRMVKREAAKPIPTHYDNLLKARLEQNRRVHGGWADKHFHEMTPDEFASHPGTLWHGSPAGKEGLQTGSHSGIHTDGDDFREYGYNGDKSIPGNIAHKGGYHQEVSKKADGTISPVVRRSQSPVKGYDVRHDPQGFDDFIAGRGGVTARDSQGNYAGHMRWDEDGVFSQNVHEDHQHVADHLIRKMRQQVPKIHRQAALSGNDWEISRKRVPTGGSKFGERYELSAMDSDGKRQGWVRYHEPKRKGSPMHVEEVRGDVPGVASHLLNHMESLHPNASRTVFLGDNIKRDKNTPKHTTGDHGKPTDWDQHYDSIGDLHRGFVIRMDPYDARKVNSADRSPEDHVKTLLGQIGGGRAGTHWTSGLRESQNFSQRNQSDPRTDIPVILHAQKPERKDIETRPSELFRHGVFPYDHVEKEVPIRKGRDVVLTGMSWKPDVAHPEADEQGWLHHTFDQPITKRAHSDGPSTVEDDPARWGVGGWRDRDMSQSKLRETHTGSDGYTYHHAPGSLNGDDEGYGSIYVTHGDDPHNVVGEPYYGPHSSLPERLELASRVAPDHRRRGVATGMYDFAERLTGKQTAPADSHSDQAAAFWSHRRASRGSVTINYLHNTERAPHPGDTYGQDIEPHGRYLIEGYQGRTASAGDVQYISHQELRNMYSGDYDAPMGKAHGSMLRDWRDYKNGELDQDDIHSGELEHGGPTAHIRHLQDDIAQNGLKEPLVIRGGNVVVDGNHRGVAALNLRLDKIPVRHVAHRKEGSNDMATKSAYATRHHRIAMPWFNNNDGVNPSHAKSVRDAGYAGYVGDSERDEELGHGGHEDEFDEDMWDRVAPEPTHEEQQHIDEHGDYPDSYYERHDEAYGEAKHRKAQEDEMDHDDPELHHFIGEHGSNSALWKEKGTFGKINIKDQPVYATQSHVNQQHIDHYTASPGDISHSMRNTPGYGQRHAQDPYLADEHPMFVTHEGRLHVTDGHHRVAAALQSGQKHIMGWHYDGDKHGFPDEDEDDYGWARHTSSHVKRGREASSLSAYARLVLADSTALPYPEINPEHLSTPDARRSRQVSPDEFQGFARRGRQRYQELSAGGSTEGLDKGWSRIKEDAFRKTRQPWGGTTVNAHTGRPLSSKKRPDLYAMTVRDPGDPGISIPSSAKGKQFDRAMEQARKQYGHILGREGHHLGVFHDADKGTVDIDPVYVTPHHKDVEEIGAYTHSVGGAYNFKDGNGYWPPHVRRTTAALGAGGDGIERPRHSTFMRAMQHQRQAEDEETRTREGVTHAGLIVKASDTGRVVVLQRSYKDEEDPARGALEFPGGRIDPGESAYQAACREWQEETGAHLPEGDPSGSFISNGLYKGFIMVVPSEDDVDIHEAAVHGNPDDPFRLDPEVVMWIDIEHLADGPATRDEVKSGTDWGMLRRAAL